MVGVEYELDCLIFATGFEVGTDYSRRAVTSTPYAAWFQALEATSDDAPSS